ncbi:hypothetical protein H0R92_12605 [Treponema sp. OMZ 840]|uniref:hypothetical protein n=1 Tax=Treponema sp. OMZ 840 TaxID=244313 RepID=UPI003D92C4DE
MSYDVYTIYWDEVEGFDREVYNEAFLADVREKLKKNEESINTPLYIEPRFYSGTGDFWACAQTYSEELFEAFTAAMLHTARRLKDCKRIAGFILPDFDTDWAALCAAGIPPEKTGESPRASYTDFFKGAFAKKYPHYEFIERQS